jgi:rubrerythrin
MKRMNEMENEKEFSKLCEECGYEWDTNEEFESCPECGY